MTTLCDAAINYATVLGWHVFPLKPKDKTPLTPHGVRDATKDVAQIRRWWTQYPNANIGIACGPSGLVVVDMDGEEGAESWHDLKQKYALNDQTVTCLTARGQHLYFASNGVPVRNSAGKLRSGLDVRAEWGYVVAPPSVHPSGKAYEWEAEYTPFDCALQPFPAALAHLLAEPATEDSAKTERIREGMRNTTLTSIAGRLRHRGWERDEIEAELRRINRKRCDPPLPEGEVEAIAKSVSRYATGGETEAESLQKDYGHAAILAELFRDSFRWALHRGRWMHYDGNRWQVEPEEVVAKEAVESLRMHYAGLLVAAASRSEMQELAKKIQETCIYARMTGALSFLKGWRHIMTQAHEWDADPWLLNLKNGTLDLRTGILRPHDPRDLITKLAPVDYDAHAQGELWDMHICRFLPNPNIRRQVQRELGRSLPGVTLEETLPIWYGQGANGKTTTARVLRKILGDYAGRAAPNLLVQTKYERHPTEIADLAGLRLVFSVEIEHGKRLAEALVKELTGGDELKGRFMRQDFFGFDPSFSIILICNHKPIITGEDDGIWRRIRLIPWEYSIPQEERRPQDEVVEALVAEGSAVLNWLLSGLKDWQQDRHWVAEEVRAASDAYRAEMDVLGEFLADRCESGPRFSAGVGELYQAYQQWCEAAGEEAMGKTRFGGLLRQRGLGQGRASAGARRWIGIRLKQ